MPCGALSLPHPYPYHIVRQPRPYPYHLGPCRTQDPSHAPALVTPIVLSRPYPSHAHAPVTPIPLSYPYLCRTLTPVTVSAMPIPLLHPWPLHTPCSAISHLLTVTAIATMIVVASSGSCQMMRGAAPGGPWRRAFPVQEAAILTPTCMRTPTWYTVYQLPACLCICLPD